MSSTIIVTPIYKPALDEMEFFSLDFSYSRLVRNPRVLCHPDDLDIGYYRERFPSAQFLPLPAIYFSAHATYNQLCYEPGFYEVFLEFSHLLLLQTDAIVVRDDLDYWCKQPYDFIGAPESAQYTYDINAVPPFDRLPNLKPYVINGCNGGLSLRRVSAMLDALKEYPDLTSFFRNYSHGIGEDIFFSMLSRVSKHFRMPNEIIASDFAFTDHFMDWFQFRGQRCPMGFHGWFRHESDREQVLGMIATEFQA